MSIGNYRHDYWVNFGLLGCRVVWIAEAGQRSGSDKWLVGYVEANITWYQLTDSEVIIFQNYIFLLANYQQRRNILWTWNSSEISCLDATKYNKADAKFQHEIKLEITSQLVGKFKIGNVSFNNFMKNTSSVMNSNIGLVTIMQNSKM